ncbi:hypothetical protein BSKO_06714 [Bryopsis sp. KO-2023]|nr:hypothetical protein BSKO_06714 [Bryopsis sp. KO-2023]
MADKKKGFGPSAKCPQAGYVQSPWQSVPLCPWNHLLNFHQPKLEHTYLTSIHRSVCMSDLNTCGLAAGAILFEMVCGAKTGMSLFHWCRLILCIAIPGILGICCRSGRFPYTSNNPKGRLQVLPFVRALLCGMATLSFVMDYQSHFLNHEGQSVLDAPPTTTIAPLVFTSLGLRLPFNMHVWVQGLATLVSLPWVVPFHGDCTVNPILANSVNEVGYGIEDVLVRISVLGYPLNRPGPLPGDYPCWLVGAFVHVFVGFVVPTFILYLLELRSRYRFLKSTLQDGCEDAKELKKFCWCGVAGFSFLATVGTQMFWFTVKEIGKKSSWC